MDYIRLTPENIDKEHICCAISGDKDPQVVSKKQWLRERMDDGLVFLKADLRGKCFIEFIPAEKAWVPIDADGYMHINCFWVSGSCKGQGYSNDLLEQCIEDAKAKGKKGLTVISSPKKKPFLSDPGYLEHKGFMVADTAEPYFTLMYLPFDMDAMDADMPRFKQPVKTPHINDKGFVIYYTNGCPFNAKYMPILEKSAAEHGIGFKSIRIDSLEDAKNAPAAWTNYAVFYDGKYITNEMLSEKKFLALNEELSKN
jgi:ribosomal protein S18 acetylase RimI-like enzyme